MNQTSVEHRLRLFMLVFAVLIFIGTAIELLLIEHTGSVVQVIPLLLIGLGLLAIIAALLRPGRGQLLLLRAVMVVVIAGSLFGIYEHILHNYEFAEEIRPNATGSELMWEAMSGASPLLSPGVLAIASVLALAATYRHPGLNGGKQN